MPTPNRPGRLRRARREDHAADRDGLANGEIFVRFEESVRGSDAFVLQSCPNPLNQWVMEALIMIDALKRGSAKRISVILPFYPYARQDKKHRGQ